MAELDKILSDIKSARERRASKEEIDALNARVANAADAAVTASEMANGMARNLGRSVAGRLPGRSAITAAVTANNPILAGAVQLIDDMKNAQREASDIAQSDRQDGLAAIKEEMSQLINDVKQPKPEPEAADKLEPMVNNTVNFDELVEIGRGQLQVLNSMYKEWSGNDHEVIKAMNKQAEEAEKLAKITEEMRLAEEMAYAEDKLRSAEEKGGTSPIGGGAVPTSGDADDADLTPMFGLLGGLGGLSTMAANLLAPLKKVLKLFRVGPLALVAAAWDFGQGFMNASEILGKDNVQITDRIQAGIANIMGGIGQLGDWIAGLFGFETDIQSFLTNNTIDLTQPLVDGLNKITGYLSGMWDGITPDTSLVDIPSMVMDNVGRMTKEAILAVTDFDWDNAGDGLKGAMGVFWDTIIEKLTGVFDLFSSDDDTDKPKIIPKSGYTTGFPQTASPDFSYITKPNTKVAEAKRIRKEEKTLSDKLEAQKKEEQKALIASQKAAEAVVQTTLQNNVNNNTTIASKNVTVVNPNKTKFGFIE
ncbi:hypothetical protein VPHD492_0080 [Vibrio phage D492]